MKRSSSNARTISSISAGGPGGEGETPAPSILRAASVALVLFVCPLLVAAQVRPQFEVVAIKPAAPDLSGDFVLGLNAQRAQVHIAWASLLDLVNMGYGVKRYQISGPPGFGNDHFTVDAKIPDGLTRRQVPEMLQSMLDVRFGMKSHWEKKELPVYTLTLTRPDPTLTEVAAPDEQLSVPIGNINNVTHYARPAAPRTTKATARCGSRWSCAEGSFYADVMSVLAKPSPTNNSESPSDLAVA